MCGIYVPVWLNPNISQPGSNLSFPGTSPHFSFPPLNSIYYLALQTPWPTCPFFSVCVVPCTGKSGPPQWTGKFCYLLRPIYIFSAQITLYPFLYYYSTMHFSYWVIFHTLLLLTDKDFLNLPLPHPGANPSIHPVLSPVPPLLIGKIWTQ